MARSFRFLAKPSALSAHEKGTAATFWDPLDVTAANEQAWVALIDAVAAEDVAAIAGALPHAKGQLSPSTDQGKLRRGPVVKRAIKALVGEMGFEEMLNVQRKAHAHTLNALTGHGIEAPWPLMEIDARTFFLMSRARHLFTAVVDHDFQAWKATWDDVGDALTGPQGVLADPPAKAWFTYDRIFSSISAKVTPGITPLLATSLLRDLLTFEGMALRQDLHETTMDPLQAWQRLHDQPLWIQVNAWARTEIKKHNVWPLLLSEAVQNLERDGADEAAWGRWARGWMVRAHRWDHDEKVGMVRGIAQAFWGKWPEARLPLRRDDPIDPTIVLETSLDGAQHDVFTEARVSDWLIHGEGPPVVQGATLISSNKMYFDVTDRSGSDGWVDAAMRLGREDVVARLIDAGHRIRPDMVPSTRGGPQDLGPKATQAWQDERARQVLLLEHFQSKGALMDTFQEISGDVEPSRARLRL